MKKALLGLVVVISTVGFCSVLEAQVTGARMEGVITDETQAVVPGVAVTITNVETGISRASTTDGGGRYIFSNLPPARYDLETSLPGFKTTLRQGITLTVGSEVVVDLTLSVGALTEQVTVTGEAPLVETRTGALAGVVEEKVIRDLPLNGRSFTDLIQLQVGVVRTRAGRQANMSGFGDKMSLGGARPHQMSFQLDGADMMARNNTNPSGASGIMMGVDTIQEFRVSTSSFSSEFGKNSGGVVSAVTKSGTNNFHGAAYEFLRNDNLDARNFFDIPAKPEFKRNQFGGTVGGPIVQNRTFFFGNYEGLRERLASARVEKAPTAAARLDGGLVPKIAESIKPYIALYPLPNGEDLGGGIGEYIWFGSKSTTQHSFLTRVDHQLSDIHSLMGRVMFDDARIVNPSEFGLVGQLTASRIQNYVLSYKRIFGASAVNDIRVNFHRQSVVLTDESADSLNGLEFIPGRGFGNFSPRGIDGISTGGSNPIFWHQNFFEYIDDAAVARGRHALKFGGIAKRIRYNSLNVGRLRGEYQFRTLEDTLVANVNRYQAGHITQGMRGQRQWMFGFYFQDDIRASSRLTLNLGVRYEFVTTVTEAHGRVSNLRNQLDSQFTLGDPYFLNPSLKNFAPRIGFAYDVTGESQTAIRGGFGIFYDQLLQLYWRDSIDRVLPWTRRFVVAPGDVPGGIPFPDAINLFDLGGEPLSDPNMAPELMPYEPHQPYTMQYNLSVQHQLLPDLSVLIAFMGSQSRNNSRNVNWNTALPTAIIDGQKWFAPGSKRRNPNLSSVMQREFDATSSYNSLQVAIKKRFSYGFNFDSVYQWSKVMDQMSGIAGSTDFANVTSFSMDPDDRKRDHGRAAFDIRHYLTLNSTYDIPSGALEGLARQALGGWRLSSLVNYSSGEPFTAANRFDRSGATVRIFGFQERPNLAPGSSSNNPVEGVAGACAGRNAGKQLGTRDVWFDPCALELQPAGFFGNLGRNTLQGPDLMTVDLAVVKDFSMGEAKRLEFRWEMFNMFNRANFSQPDFGVFSSPTRRNVNASRITSTRTTSRQIQFGLKFIF